jgi:uncharacterized protein
VAANVTNTVALLGNAVGGLPGSRPELAGRRDELRRLALPAVLGGATGSALLLLTPPGVFERIVPWLIGFASLAVLVRRPPRPPSSPHPPPGSRRLWWGVLAVCCYGGYFGAAAGVVLLALALWATGQGVARASALRLVLLSLANGVAALAFAVAGPVHWPAALAMGAGCAAGGGLGPVVLRHAPDGALRAVIALTGLALAIHLALDAY